MVAKQRGRRRLAIGATARGDAVPDRAIAIDSDELVRKALRMGAIAAKVVKAQDVSTGHWVRWKCRYGCGGFGSNLMCPPHTPTPAETRAMLDGYARAVLFESPPGRTKEIAFALERELFLEGHYKALGLGAGPCLLCRTCAMRKGCRHPDRARPAMEACGIDVFATARRHGFAIEVVRTRRSPQHYFGLVLVD